MSKKTTKKFECKSWTPCYQLEKSSSWNRIFFSFSIIISIVLHKNRRTHVFSLIEIATESFVTNFHHHIIHCFWTKKTIFFLCLKKIRISCICAARGEKFNSCMNIKFISNTRVALAPTQHTKNISGEVDTIFFYFVSVNFAFSLYFIPVYILWVWASIVCCCFFCCV